MPGTPHRNKANDIASYREEGNPYLVASLGQNRTSLLGIALGWELNSILIAPKHFSGIKVDAMLLLVRLAFEWIILELHAV